MRKQYIKRHLEKNVAKNKGCCMRPVRFALPFSVQCNNCKGFLSKNARYNALKEILKEQTIFGVEVYRFILKCKQCRGVFTLLTDPVEGRYKTELGCRNTENGGLVDQTARQEKKTFQEEVSVEVKDFINLNELERNARRLLECDLGLVARAISSGKTVQALRREELVRKLSRKKQP